MWSLELLLLIRRDTRLWPKSELISTLRASDLVVTKTLDELLAAGIITLEGDGARYMPASEDISRHIEEVDKLYRIRPDAVRRAIVASSASGATAFADAFRLRKD